MQPKKTALILIGYQNDYFASDGLLHDIVKQSLKDVQLLENTLHLIEHLDDEALIISTPIIFTDGYKELEAPVGILETIKEIGAFKNGNKGSETIEEIKALGDRVLEVPGKVGLNAFHLTELESILKQHEIVNVVLAGVVCSICIDSTGRSAFEKGYKVNILSDCTSGRTTFEQDFYCESVFPLYANVITSHELLSLTDIVHVG
ncbi:MAG: cysteine hydrolase family protein [Bacteroidota bacterium]